MACSPTRDICNCRAPHQEQKLAPIDHQRVLLVPFIERGLSLPLHDFVRGLLFFYGLQLHHLSHNGILHIACFITLCECFWGLGPIGGCESGSST